MSSLNGDGNWRRQAALLAAWTSGLIGLGVVVAFLVLSRDAGRVHAPSTPSSAAPAKQPIKQ